MAKMTQFMKPQIYEGKWIEVVCSDGTWWLPAVVEGMDDLGIPMWWKGELTKIWKNNSRVFSAQEASENMKFNCLLHFYEIYLPGHSPISFEVKQGFGARLSAPGYLDSTDWGFFGTYNEAKVYLEDLMDGKENA